MADTSLHFSHHHKSIKALTSLSEYQEKVTINSEKANVKAKERDERERDALVPPPPPLIRPLLQLTPPTTNSVERKPLNAKSKPEGIVLESLDILQTRMWRRKRRLSW